MAPNPLRNIPSLNELLESPQLRGLVDRISRSAVVRTARKVIDEITTELHTATAEKTLPSASDLAERIARRVVED
jgi:L-seryl-tRNA(Ser) seleniumtransferase